MTDRPILGPDWQDFIDQICNQLESRTSPQAPSLPPALADAFNTCSLCIFLASCAVIDDRFCEMFREAESFGMTKEQLPKETFILATGPFPSVAGFYHGDQEKKHRDKVDSLICLYQTSILAQRLLEPIAVVLIQARGELGGPITRSGFSNVTAHHLAITFADEVLRLGCPDFLVGNPRGPDKRKYTVPSNPRIFPIPATIPIIDFNELSDQMLTEACLAAQGWSETARPPSSQRVVLRGREEGPVVLGKTKRALTTPQYNVVKALLDAGDAGLTKDELVSKSRHEDARGILKRLADSDPDWKEVIHFAGQTGGGYRIK